MEFLKIINKQFESIYDETELQTVNITSEEIEKVIELANMPIPDLLLDIFKTG